MAQAVCILCCLWSESELSFCMELFVVCGNCALFVLLLRGKFSVSKFALVEEITLKSSSEPS
jgi:hypothetical protein